MKKILVLLIFLFIFFGSIGFVCSADNGSSLPNSNNFTVTVEHNPPVHGKQINFTVTVKDSNNNPVANRLFAFALRARSDTSSNPEGRIDYSQSTTTDSNGVFKVNWPGNGGWYDYYDLTISDGLDGNIHPTGNIYYKKTFDFGIKTSLSFSKPQTSVYEGEFIVVRAYVTSLGKPLNGGNLVWHYANGKSVPTAVVNGVSIFRYSSYKLGNNIIYVNYIGFGPNVQVPGWIVSNTSISKSFSINVKGASDLLIAKIVRSGNKYKVIIKNIGNGASSATKLKLWYSNKKYKIISVSPLGVGKSKTYVVNFFKYSTHKKYNKYAQINYNKATYEKNYANNKLIFKSDVAYGLAADLKITKVTRSGNNYIVTIKNNGNLAASAFKLKFWYGSKTRAKGLVSYTIKKFGQYGKKLPSGVSIALTIPYYPYKTHSKYYKFVSVNSDKKIPESNYANNLKKFKV